MTPTQPTVLRSFAAPLLLLVAVLFDTCTVPIPWAVQPTLPPAPSISAEDAASFSTLLDDALLDDADFPSRDADGATRQGWDITRGSSQYYVGFQDGGGQWVASRRWSHAAPAEYASLTDERLLFETDEQAAAFLAAHPSPLPENYLQLPEVVDFAEDSHVYSDTESPDPGFVAVRRVQVRSAVGRIVIQQFLTLRQDRSDWETVTRQLLVTAQLRTRDALNATGT